MGQDRRKRLRKTFPFVQSRPYIDDFSEGPPVTSTISVVTPFYRSYF
ncbi:hypothetical protein ACFLTT_02705 [Chloroflexota bacterium]